MATREEQRAYQREWVARRRQDWIEANGPCARCGSGEDLQVDHVDPAQKVDHRVWSWSKVRRDEELAKCQVLCGDCHRDKTFEDQNTGICRNGHLRTPENTEWNDAAHTERACVQCRRDRQARAR